MLLGAALALCLAPGHGVTTPPVAKPPKKQTLPKVEAEAAAEAAPEEPAAEAAEEAEAAAAEAVAEESAGEAPEVNEEEAEEEAAEEVDTCVRCMAATQQKIREHAKA